jgi:hypothetical protein
LRRLGIGDREAKTRGAGRQVKLRKKRNSRYQRLHAAPDSFTALTGGNGDNGESTNPLLPLELPFLAAPIQLHPDWPAAAF